MKTRWIVLVGLVLALSSAGSAQAIDWKEGTSCSGTTVQKAFPPKDGHTVWCPSDGANSAAFEVGSPGMVLTWKETTHALSVYRCVTTAGVADCVGWHDVPAATSCAGGTTPCSSFFLPPGIYVIDPAGSASGKLVGTRSQ